MKWFVYILSINDGKYYIWSTINLENRIKEHEKWEVKSTRNKKPIRLIFYKEFKEIKKARRIEWLLKKLKKREYVEKFMDWKVF